MSLLATSCDGESDTSSRSDNGMLLEVDPDEGQAQTLESTIAAQALPAEEMEPNVGSDELSADQPTSEAWGTQSLFRVKITNMTQTQWFTPPVVATHSPFVAFFRAGFPAPEGVRQIAENGNNDPILAALDESGQVVDFAAAVGDPPPLGPGASISVDLVGSTFLTRLSVASMLICTNDGFMGLDAQRLPSPHWENPNLLRAGLRRGV